MKFTAKLQKKAIKDLKAIPLKDRKQIIAKIELLENDLNGDVKKLTNFTPEYRMRSGNWRVLFEVEENTITIYRVIHRREAYR